MKLLKCPIAAVQLTPVMVKGKNILHPLPEDRRIGQTVGMRI
jgi:hypothetical protein